MGWGWGPGQGDDFNKIFNYNFTQKRKKIYIYFLGSEILHDLKNHCLVKNEVLLLYKEEESYKAKQLNYIKLLTS